MLPKNQNTYIALGVRNQLENYSKTNLRLIVVQSDRYFGENDTVRFENIFDQMIAVSMQWAPLCRIDLSLNDMFASEPNSTLSGNH